MCLVLGKDSTDSMRWWIDASYAVHPDMHCHTGATMSMGNGSVFSGSWKQKLVTQSSTESEVVSIYDILPQILWTKKFLEDQGVSIKETVLYQDNIAPCFSSGIGDNPARNELNTWIFGTFMWVITSKTKPYLCITALLTRCWPTTSLSHYKALSSQSHHGC